MVGRNGVVNEKSGTGNNGNGVCTQCWVWSSNKVWMEEKRKEEKVVNAYFVVVWLEIVSKISKI